MIPSPLWLWHNNDEYKDYHDDDDDDDDNYDCDDHYDDFSPNHCSEKTLRWRDAIIASIRAFVHKLSGFSSSSSSSSSSRTTITVQMETMSKEERLNNVIWRNFSSSLCARDAKMLQQFGNNNRGGQHRPSLMIITESIGRCCTQCYYYYYYCITTLHVKLFAKYTIFGRP